MARISLSRHDVFAGFCISIWHGTLHSAAHRVIIQDFFLRKTFSRLQIFVYEHRFLSSLK